MKRTSECPSLPYDGGQKSADNDYRTGFASGKELLAGKWAALRDRCGNSGHFSDLCQSRTPENRACHSSRASSVILLNKFSGTENA